jgi:predicted RNA binding protein YcfA (HicA-like mRNA interferase family)
MPRKLRQLKVDLREAGAYQVSQEGSHIKWKHPLVAVKILIYLVMMATTPNHTRKKLFVIGCNKLQKRNGGLDHEYASP